MLEKELKEILVKPINNAGYILDNITYKKENNENTLTIVIDKKDGYINIEDCVTINKIINPILDEKDLIDESYVLDVCSKQKGSE